MKAAAIISTVVMIFLLGITAALYMNCTVEVESVTVQAMLASDRPEYFTELKRKYEDGSVTGTCFRTTELGDAEDYLFYTYTFRVKNNCMVTADMIEFMITPMNGDILQIGDTEVFSLGRGHSGTRSVVLLTGKDTVAAREINVSFYVWGLPIFMKTIAK